MADVKISGLPASTTPLAGTEVLPIVQSGVTKQVANNDLRPKQIQSNATSGVLQITGPASATTRIMTTPDANFTAARIDAAQSFTGDQTLATGNLVIGTSGKGIDFSATPGTGTSELLSDYEEGTFTATFNIGATANATRTATYTKIGNIVYYSINFFVGTYTKSGTGNLTVSGLPFVSKTSFVCMGEIGYFEGYNSTTNGFPYLELLGASQTLTLFRAGVSNYVNMTDANFATSTLLFRISGTYLAN
jgi:hypothetical protein